MEKETGQHAIGDEGQDDKLDKCTWGKREGWLIGKNAHDATPSSKSFSTLTNYATKLFNIR
jgi:hypothetical protein